MNLVKQKNERRCKSTTVTHHLPLPQCCPISGNPQPGSSISITYEPDHSMLEVASLVGYIDSYKGGRGEVRSMEGMIQSIAQDCANCVEVKVVAFAELIIYPGQSMAVECEADSVET